jgi:pilus assembly protein FimV
MSITGLFGVWRKYIMSRRFTRLSLLFVLMLTSEVWAIGLGDINLNSALNEPLRAEIVLLSANADELSDLTVTLASAETFARYGIDRPFFLQDIEFNVINAGAGRSVVKIRSRAPITEPFLTFLVEATWSSGRLLREYTVLLDPPTYAAPTSQQAPAVEAPRRSMPSDSGQIQRQPTPPPTQRQSRPAPQPTQPARTSDSSAADTSVTDSSYESPPEPRPQPPVDDSPYGTADGDDLVVQRGETLWGLTARNRPDGRLSMNQTMLAIYQANPGAFGGNINVLRAGASLRIPGADEVFQINRGDALSEVQRQHNAWDGGTRGTSYTEPQQSTTRPSLTLVPPDEDPVGGDYDDASTYEPQSREQEIEGRIAELESADVPNQQSLIEIRDNELAALRQELADIRDEVYEAPVEDVADDPLVEDLLDDDQGIDDAVDDSGIDDIVADDVADDTQVDDTQVADDTADDVVDSDITTPPSDIISTSSSSRDKGFVDQILGYVISIWGGIAAAVVAAVGLLVWFMRREGGDDDDNDRPWESLDSDEMVAGSISTTSTMQAPTHEEAIVVVEQDSGVHPILEDTVEAPAADLAAGEGEASGAFGSLEDTFSSETAINLDQTDPIAEADFHMAYGLYDQAADLINGALESDPSDKSLMSKLCEIYFVWGNRDSFVDAATRLKLAVGDDASTDWDKIVIMGQQIAADHELFAGAELAGLTKEVDLSFDEGGDEAGALDMDFGASDSGASDVIDLGSIDEETQEGVDFNFDEPAADADDAVDFNLDVTAQTPTIESTMTEATAEMPAPTVETPTIEDQFAGFGEGTSELPSLDENSLEEAIPAGGRDADATGEINVDELDLGIDDLTQTEVASLDDMDVTGQNEELSDTGINEALSDLDFDVADVTGKNPAIDPDATGVQEGLDPNATGLVEGLDLSDLESSGMRLAADETGQNPMVSAEPEQEPTDVGIDDSLLDATGLTQVLSDDMAVETAAGLAGALSDADATMLASGAGDATIDSPPEEPETMLAPMDEDDDFDFAKTEALPPNAFTSNMDLDATAETPAIAGTDVDLDLDDLTAALQVSEIGDTIEQPRDDATVEQPRPTITEETAEVPTMSLAPEDMSGDLHEARTMTEVGTKLDLARAYVDMGDPAGARSILEEVLDEGDNPQKQQAQQLLDSLPS